MPDGGAGGDALTVLHIDTERGWRGGQRQVLWLADMLQTAGHRNIIAARRGEPLAEHAASRGLNVVTAAPRSELALAVAWKLRRLIRREGVQVVHAHTGHAVALAALATRRTHAAMVVTRRVVFPLKGDRFTRWKYGRADAMIAISRAVADTLERCGIEPRRITVVPSGVDLGRRVVPASAEVLRSFGIRTGPLVVMVAALTAEKDPVTFVRAMAAARAEAPGVQALLVGNGPLRHAVEAEITRLGLGDTVHMAGLRPDADSLLAAADVVALTSVEEGLGTVLIDAAHFGKPAVATRVGGIAEIVEHGVTGLLAPPRDADAIGGAIAALLADDARRARLAAGAQRRAVEFSLTRTADRTVAVYRQAIASRRT